MTDIAILAQYSAAHCVTTERCQMTATAGKGWGALRRAILGEDAATASGLARGVPDLPRSLPAGTTAIGVFLGLASSGGQSAQIAGIREEADRVVVEWSHRYPDGPATMALTRPFTVALIPTPSKPIVFTQVPDSAPNGLARRAPRAVATPGP